MPQRASDSTGKSPPGMALLIAGQSRLAAGILLLSVVCWLFLVWIAVDMSQPFAQLTMPASSNWRGATVFAVWTMWALMMAAMMLPSALPMILTFVNLCVRTRERTRGSSFVAAYLIVWFVFSAGATAAQWTLQAMDWVNPMIVSTSALLTALLLLIAGVYQFSRVKQVCLSHCRTPMGFLIGEWRAGWQGAFVMGLRHGLLCVGCCWALMALLFVGGVMNLAWIAALSLAVAVEKLAPGGERLGSLLGLGLIAAGLVKLLVLVR
jgi:predicted metal-binding membrane protein